MMLEFIDHVQRLRLLNRPFAIATVIAVRGSASAKPGSKALIDETGKNVWGWVGGGCAETFVGRNAVEAMSDGMTRIVEADLDDEIFGLGMPCGGVMDVYIEPQKPIEILSVHGESDTHEMALHLARAMGFKPRFETGTSEVRGSALERSVYAVAKAVAGKRGASFTSLQSKRDLLSGQKPVDKKDRRSTALSEFVVVGSSRITEELAKFGAILRWPVRVYGWNLDSNQYPKTATLEMSDAGFTNFSVRPDSWVVVASHHKGDHDFIRQSLESGAAYVGLVASPKRSGLIFDHLGEQSSTRNLDLVSAPAGLEMFCSGPQEIALSIAAEVIERKNGRNESLLG